MTQLIRLNQSLQSAQHSYQEELNAGRFLIQKCSVCEQNIFPPREACPDCGSSELDWIQPSGGGTVYATTTVRRKQESGGDYNVSLIDLDDHVRMMSRVEGLEPSTVRIGMRVRSRVFHQKGCGLVVFDPFEEPAP